MQLYRRPSFDEEEETAEQVHQLGQGGLQDLPEAGRPPLLQQILSKGFHALAAHRPFCPDAANEEVLQGIQERLADSDG